MSNNKKNNKATNTNTNNTSANSANSNSSVDNIYNLDGKVPVAKAIPFGLQHILAMFVANIAPILIVAGACGLGS